MSSKTPIQQESEKVTFPVYIYPFNTKNIAPGRGGEDVEDITLTADGIDISQRNLQLDMACEDRLWWISLSEEWLQNISMNIPSNTTQYELEFLVTALNICVTPEVFFTRFARREYVGIILNDEVKRPSDVIEFVTEFEREIPKKIEINGGDLIQLVSWLMTDVEDTLDTEHSDLIRAIESYRAAVQSFNTEVHARLLYSVCENALLSGSPTSKEKDKKIAEVGSINEEEARAWRHLTNRTKHPDRGTNYSWSDTFEDVPPPVEIRMRETANNSLYNSIPS